MSLSLFDVSAQILGGVASTAGRKFVPDWGTGELPRLKDGQGGGGDEELDGTRGPGGTADEAEPFELHNHLMNGGRGHPEEGLHVRFGRGTSVERGVGVDKGEILALQGRVPGRGRISGGFARHFGQFTQRGARACLRNAPRKSSERGEPRYNSNAGRSRARHARARSRSRSCRSASPAIRSAGGRRGVKRVERP